MKERKTENRKKKKKEKEEERTRKKKEEKKEDKRKNLQELDQFLYFADPLKMEGAFASHLQKNHLHGSADDVDGDDGGDWSDHEDGNENLKSDGNGKVEWRILPGWILPVSWRERRALGDGGSGASTVSKKDLRRGGGRVKEGMGLLSLEGPWNEREGA
jgi:hypothetical protein